ncbi:MAG: hypothetical protein FJ211_01375 [Ignavibacteria bacterium]|nr:hypothetical protein [Ignavibacteria bacterium]
MPSEFGLPFVLLMHLIMGGSVLGALGLRTTKTITAILSVFAGMFIHSMLFFGCDLVGVPLTATSMFRSAILGVLCTLPMWKTTRDLVRHLRTIPPRGIGLYDIPVIGFSGYIFYMIMWASFYWPVTPFDAMAGIDLVATYTVVDHTIVNQVFTHPSLQGQLSNQPFYAPFTMLMQVIMKLIGFTHNQVWVGIVAVLFSIFMWAALRQLVHPTVASVLYLLFLLTPEMFGYTYLLQTDYVNAVFIVCGVYLFWNGAERSIAPMIWSSAVFFAAAAWSRTEAPLLIVLGCGLTFMRLKNAFGSVKAMRMVATIIGVSFITFALWHVLFFNVYLPVRPSSADQLVGFSFGRFWDVIVLTCTNVVLRVDLWGIIVWLFGAVMFANVVAYRRTFSVILSTWIAAVMLGLWLAGTIFSAAIVEQTLRRGMFKVVPLLVLAIAASQLVTSASSKIAAWELRRSS